MDGRSDPPTALTTNGRDDTGRQGRHQTDDKETTRATNGEASFPLPIVRAAHPDDLSAFYERYSGNLYRLAISILGCPETAKDVVQDAFTATATRLADGLVIENLGGWLYRVVQYQCRMQYRAHVAAPLVDGVDVAPGMLPDELADLRHRMDQIRRAVDKLGEAQKSAFLLAEVHGLSYREIGEKIDRTEDGVRQLLFRARGLVRDAIGAETFGLLPVLLPGAYFADLAAKEHAVALTGLAPQGRLAILRDRVSGAIDGVGVAAHTALPVFAVLAATVLSAPSSERVAGPRSGGQPPPSVQAFAERSVAGHGPARRSGPTGAASATVVAAVGGARSGAQSGDGGVTSPNRHEATGDGRTRQESSGVQPSTSSGGSAGADASPQSVEDRSGGGRTRDAYVTGSRAICNGFTCGAPSAWDYRGEVSVFDTFVDEPASTASLPVGGMEDPTQRATAVAFAPDGLSAYVALRHTNTPGGRQEDLALVDTVRVAFARQIKVPSDPVAVSVAPNSSNAFLGYAFPPQGGSSAGVLAVATANDATATVGATESHFHGVAITPDSSAVYVSDTGGVDIYGATGPWPQLPRRIALKQPGAIAITPNGTRAYVTRPAEHAISVIGTDPNNRQTYDRVETIPDVGQVPADIAITPDGTRAYVTDPPAGMIRVIGTDPSDQSTYDRVLPESIKVATPGALAITPNGKRAYVTNIASNKVTMIDTDIGSPTFNRARCCVAAGELKATDIAIVPNQGPSLERVTATPASAGQPTTLEAQGASDSDGYVAQYRWDFGDGAPPVTTDEATTTHTYANPGDYTATATAIDNEGGDGTLVTDGRAIYHNRSEGARKGVPIPVGPGATPPQGGGGGGGSGPTASGSPAAQGTASQSCTRALVSQPVSVGHWLPFAGSFFRLVVLPGAHFASDFDVTLQVRRAKKSRAPAAVGFSVDGNPVGTDTKPPYKVVGAATRRGAHRVEAAIASNGKTRNVALDVYGLECENAALSVGMRNKQPGKRTNIYVRAQTANQEPLSAATVKLPRLLRVNTRRAEGVPIGTLQLLTESGAIKFSRPLMLVRKGRHTFELAGKGNGPKATLARSRPGYTVSLAGLGRYRAPRVRLTLIGRQHGFLTNAPSCKRYLYSATLTTTGGQSHRLDRGLQMCKGRPGAR